MGAHEHNHDCDCGGDCECHDIELIVLPEENGSEREYAIIEIFTVKETEYYACVPYVDDELTDEVRFLRSEPLNENEIEITDIEDEDEFEMVCDVFDELLDSREFEDEE